MQGGEPIHVSAIKRGLVFKKHRKCFFVAILGGIDEWGSSVYIHGIYMSTMLNKEPENSLVASDRLVHIRSPLFDRLCIDLCASG
mmetsp:Transcript_7967/g.14145  ORF Transcript_7967/g.14145 Transcript_7967/m.14145 type:complete len:85 (+) Transcript_7967:578-832(+)